MQNSNIEHISVFFLVEYFILLVLPNYTFKILSSKYVNLQTFAMRKSCEMFVIIFEMFGSFSCIIIPRIESDNMSDNLFERIVNWNYFVSRRLYYSRFN